MAGGHCIIADLTDAVSARYGMRGALEIAGLLYAIEHPDSEDPKSIAEKNRASEALQALADELKTTRQTVEVVMKEIWQERTVEFLIDVWEGLD